MACVEPETDGSTATDEAGHVWVRENGAWWCQDPSCYWVPELQEHRLFSWGWEQIVEDATGKLRIWTP